MTEKERFATELRFMLLHFNLEKAEALSVRIHEAEEQGYEISRKEDRLWIRLTEKIQSHYQS